MLRSFNSLLEIVRNYGKIISNNYGAYTHYEWRRDMKKLLFSPFYVFMSVFLCGFAYGACVPESCGGRGDDCINIYDLTVNPSDRTEKNEVYICEKNHCENGTIVHNNALDKFYMCVIASKVGVNFLGMGNDTWEPYTVRTCETLSEGYIYNDDPNATKALRNSTNSTETLVKKDTGSSVVQVGSNICIEYKCNEGYIPNKDKTQCILDDRKSNCTSTGGTWANGKCSCSASKNIKLAANGEACECINSNYESDGVNGCRKKQSVIDSENNQQRKKACEDSGGSWTNNQCACDNAKNLKVSNNVCVCLDDVNYKRNGDRCDLTDAAALQQKCLSESSVASGAYWDDVNKQCRCTNQQYSWNGSICDMNPAILKCLQITGANWNYTTNQCYCVEVGKVINAEQTACVDANTASSGNGSSASASSEVTITQNRARENISSAVAKIEDIKSGLKLTVWRDEEGNFNTSRLLSDSIAGVVLGTAGGLITSNVVKKNQVENGFEDIQCTVGGQVVAGWGDEFRVGIQ